jgi:hypothetical protein
VGRDSSEAKASTSFLKKRSTKLLFHWVMGDGGGVAAIQVAGCGDDVPTTNVTNKRKFWFFFQKRTACFDLNYPL